MHSPQGIEIANQIKLADNDLTDKVKDKICKQLVKIVKSIVSTIPNYHANEHDKMIPEKYRVIWYQCQVYKLKTQLKQFIRFVK